jgi:hypothetical protein
VRAAAAAARHCRAGENDEGGRRLGGLVVVEAGVEVGVEPWCVLSRARLCLDGSFGGRALAGAKKRVLSLPVVS